VKGRDYSPTEGREQGEQEEKDVLYNNSREQIPGKTPSQLEQWTTGNELPESVRAEEKLKGLAA
jgi:hypothetical protein